MFKNLFFTAIACLLAGSLFSQSWPCWDYVSNFELCRVTARSGLVMRDAPNQSAAKLATIPFHELVGRCKMADGHETIEEKTDYWYQVCFNDITGYVFGGYLETVEDYPFQIF